MLYYMAHVKLNIFSNLFYALTDYCSFYCNCEKCPSHQDIIKIVTVVVTITTAADVTNITTTGLIKY